MSKLDELIAELCPDGVEYKTLGEIATITRGGNFQKKDFSTEPQCGQLQGHRPTVKGYLAYHLNFRNSRRAPELSGLCSGLSAPEGARNQYLPFRFFL